MEPFTIYTKLAIPTLKEMLRNNDNQVREEAKRGLKQLGVPAEDMEKAKEPGLQIKVFQLKHIQLSAVDDKQDNPDFQSLRPKMAKDFIDKLNAIKSKEGIITLEPDRHRIIICDTPQVLELVQSIINAEDKPPIQYQIKTAVITLDTPETMIKIQAECDNKKLDEALATIKSKYKAQVSPLLNLLLIDGQPGTYSIGEVEKDGAEKGLRASYLVQPADKSTIFLSIKTSDTRNTARNSKIQVKTRLMNDTIIVLQSDVTNQAVDQAGMLLADTFWLVEVTEIKKSK
jgi:type II secretory pathway component GspD/PulD (secretin)